MRAPDPETGHSARDSAAPALPEDAAPSATDSCCEPTLYYFAEDPCAGRIRLALGLKQVSVRLEPIAPFDDETFFALGIARTSPALKIGGDLFTDSLAWLRGIDDHVVGTAALSRSLDDGAWQALVDWRAALDPILQRLYAPLAPGFHGIGDSSEALAAYKRTVEHRFGQTLEELANDRYGAWEQFMRQSHLQALGRHLAAERFYFGGIPTIADCVIAADLFPLQMHDGVHLPVDMLYYLARVEDAAGIDLNRDWLAR